MKKITLLISLLIAICIFAFSVSASPITDFPETTGNARVEVVQHVSDYQYNNPFVSDALNLDPVLFNATCYFFMDNSSQNTLFLSVNTSLSSRDYLGRSLSNWYETSPNISFAEFIDLDVNYTLTDYLSSTFPYNNLDNLIYLFNNIGLYYKDVRDTSNVVFTLNTEITGLNNQINTLNSDKQSLLNDINTLNITINSLNDEISTLTTELSTAYSKGLEDANVIENSFISIASMPFYFLKGIFSFEIFGINFFTIIQVILTLLFVGFVVKIFI